MTALHTATSVALYTSALALSPVPAPPRYLAGVVLLTAAINAAFPPAPACARCESPRLGQHRSDQRGGRPHPWRFRVCGFCGKYNTVKGAP